MQTGLALTDPLVGARRFRRGLSEPGFETGLAELRAIAGKECPLANVHAVVARLWVCDNLARILVCGEALPGELIETNLFRPSYFNCVIHCCVYRDADH